MKCIYTFFFQQWMRTLRVFNDRSQYASNEMRLDALEQGQNFLNQKVHNIEDQVRLLSVATQELEETENKHFIEMKNTMEDYKGDINKLRRQMKSGCINNIKTKIIILLLCVWFVYFMFHIPPQLMRREVRLE